MQKLNKLDLSKIGKGCLHDFFFHCFNLQLILPEAADQRCSEEKTF